MDRTRFYSNYPESFYSIQTHYSLILKKTGSVDRSEDQLLANCYSNALQLADEKGITSIAFPAISTGAFGYPLEEAVPLAIDTIVDTIPWLKSVMRVVMVLYSASDFQAHETYLNQKMPS